MEAKMDMDEMADRSSHHMKKDEFMIHYLTPVSCECVASYRSSRPIQLNQNGFSLTPQNPKYLRFNIIPLAKGAHHRLLRYIFTLIHSIQRA